MSSREEVPKVNAGSMADIAFLLLIFFLVTTSIETDAGINRMLPGDGESVVIPQRNILPILINGNDELMVDGEVIEIKDLKELTIAFLDNGGEVPEGRNYCEYCQGARDVLSSDNPEEAIVSLMNNRETSYGAYITVQNELAAAYSTLRNREAQRLFKTDFTSLEERYLNEETSAAEKIKLKEKIKMIQGLYPMKLSEAERN